MLQASLWMKVGSTIGSPIRIKSEKIGYKILREKDNVLCE